MSRLKISKTLTKPSVCITYCHPGVVAHDWMESILKTIISNKFETTLISAESGPLLARARNHLADRFLSETTHDYMLMTDTDCVFEPDDVQALVEADAPIAGALYYGYFKGEENPVRPTATLRQPDGSYTPIEDPAIGDGHTLTVGAVGMGLTLIRRDVLETLSVDTSRAWPFAEAVIHGRALGEDITFCARAADVGLETVVVPKATIGHRKTFLI